MSDSRWQAQRDAVWSPFIKLDGHAIYPQLIRILIRPLTGDMVLIYAPGSVFITSFDP